MSDSPTALSPTPASLPVPAAAPRLDHVDALRGLAMAVMALDHVRDFFTDVPFRPEDLAHTWPALFLTRWVTHFCAPAFFLLAGAGAFLGGGRGRSPGALTRFLLTRGAWLVLLELTVVGFAWTFQPLHAIGQVIWALGWSMIALAALIRLPRPVLLAGSLAVIAGHHLGDAVHASDLEGAAAGAWTVLHDPGVIAPPGFFVLYVLVPWSAVMALGYALGPELLRPVAERRRRAVLAGVGALALFVALRATGAWGNPPLDPSQPGSGPFVAQAGLAMSVVAFLDVAKYPPSLQYLAMTLGGALVLLAALDHPRVVGSWIGRQLVVLGRVPLFYYVAHLYVIHGLALAVAWATGQPWRWLVEGGMAAERPDGYGFGLPTVFAVWIVVVAVLVPPSAAYARLKARRRDLWWLGYL